MATTLMADTADGETHEVAIYDDEFECWDCGATGLADGYLLDESGASAWHRSL